MELRHKTKHWYLESEHLFICPLTFNIFVFMVLPITSYILSSAVFAVVLNISLIYTY